MKNEESSEFKKIRDEIYSLNKRLTQVEDSIKELSLKSLTDEPEVDLEKAKTAAYHDNKPSSSIEFRIGEYGMAWLGNIVLLFGITFLVQYIQNKGYPLLSAVVSYLSIALIYAASYFLRIAFSNLSRLLSYSGHLLLYYFTLRLHFFESQPLITSKLTGLILLIVIIGLFYYLSLPRQSKIMASMVLIMALFTGLISDNISFTGISTAAVSILLMILYLRFGWIKLVFAFIFLIYLFHLNWLLNNPIMGNTLEIPNGPGVNYMNFMITAMVFSLVAIIPQKGKASEEFIIASVVWNGIGFSIILGITTFLYFKESYVLLYSAIALFCLTYSILLQSRSTIKITAAMYALYSFLAMSVAFYGIFLLPKAYTLLALESLLVVSMALWFRSRFIVIMNSLMFLTLLVFYLFDETSYSSTDFSFMAVAFLTARVINWKKDRLNLKTELIRNVYLIAGLAITLIAFHHVFPESYTTASWILAAILFFATSLLLKNIKYRWLAIASLAAASVKLIFKDMTSIDIGYRVLISLALAIISIVASILYTKYYKQKNE